VQPEITRSQAQVQQQVKEPNPQAAQRAGAGPTGSTGVIRKQAELKEEQVQAQQLQQVKARKPQAKEPKPAMLQAAKEEPKLRHRFEELKEQAQAHWQQLQVKARKPQQAKEPKPALLQEAGKEPKPRSRFEDREDRSWPCTEEADGSVKERGWPSDKEGKLGTTMGEPTENNRWSTTTQRHARRARRAASLGGRTRCTAGEF
jgi:hypothetical protein